MIIGLFTEVLSAGGVQRAGRHVAAVAACFAAEHNLDSCFLSLKDPQGAHTIRVGKGEISVSGSACGKAQFVSAALRVAGRNPKLVIALHPHVAPVVQAMALRSPKFDSLIFAHGIEVWRPMGWLRRLALRQADIVAAPSTDTVRRLVSEQGIRPERVRKLAWGLDPEFETRLAGCPCPPRPGCFPERARIILTVGRWASAERYKGADTLISAMPHVVKSAPDAFLVLVGDGDDRPRLEQLAHGLGVAAHVRFVREPSQEELFACYAQCDVFALPSGGEGFGLVFLEAMAHGRPVIGGAHGGIPDVVEDGVTGLLIRHGDMEALRRAVESLLLNPERALSMGARGRQRVQTMFTFNQFQCRLKQVLEEVLLRKQ
jgi:glycosyltransferase involved in cell wall biosynthesis